MQLTVDCDQMDDNKIVRTIIYLLKYKYGICTNIYRIKSNIFNLISFIKCHNLTWCIKSQAYLKSHLKDFLGYLIIIS